jgi:hypothetical protein
MENSLPENLILTDRVEVLALDDRLEWTEYCKGQLRNRGKKPRDIPAGPSKAYAEKGWVSWADWLGKK